MLDFVLKYWIQFLFGVLISSFSYVIKNVRSLKNYIVCNRNGTIILLKQHIFDSYENLSKKSCLTIDEKENFNELYKTYKCFEHSQIIDDLADKLNRIPIE